MEYTIQTYLKELLELYSLTSLTNQLAKIHEEIRTIQKRPDKQRLP